MKLTFGLKDDLLEVRKVDKQAGKVVVDIIPMRRIIEITGDMEKPGEIKILLDTGQGATTITCTESIIGIKKLIAMAAEAALMANITTEALDKKAMEQMKRETAKEIEKLMNKEGKSNLKGNEEGVAEPKIHSLGNPGENKSVTEGDIEKKKEEIISELKTDKEQEKAVDDMIKNLENEPIKDTMDKDNVE